MASGDQHATWLRKAVAGSKPGLSDELYEQFRQLDAAHEIAKLAARHNAETDLQLEIAGADPSPPRRLIRRRFAERVGDLERSALGSGGGASRGVDQSPSSWESACAGRVPVRGRPDSARRSRAAVGADGDGRPPDDDPQAVDIARARSIESSDWTELRARSYGPLGRVGSCLALGHREVGGHDHDVPAPLRPEPRKSGPEQAVRRLERRMRRAHQYLEPVPQHHMLEHQVAARSESLADRRQRTLPEQQHRCLPSPRERPCRARTGQTRFG